MKKIGDPLQNDFGTFWYAFSNKIETNNYLVRVITDIQVNRA